MSNLNVNEADFLLIKENIKDYLKGQSEFTDYNFEGSGMTVLMDLLAYATHYMIVYNNMTFNEMFLQTGLLRSSVVSKALELNYIPKNETSAKATLNLSITLSAPKPASVFIPKDTRFTGRNEDGNTYTFVTTDDHILTETGTSGIFQSNIDVSQGTYVTESFVWDTSNPPSIILQNDNVDMRFTEVNVEDFSGSTTITPWLNYTDIIGLTPESRAYFYRENVDGLTEIYFGNGVFGRELINNNVINIEYLVTAGEPANNISNFSLVTPISPYDISDWTITTVSTSAEGSDKESLESIKHNAPLFYQAQNRSVVKDDYIGIIQNSHGGIIEAINVWGGEDNIPPRYGRVLISIKPVGGTTLSTSTENEIKETVNNVGVLGIIPEFVDPTYIYLDLTVNAKYQKFLTTKTPSELQVIIDDALDQHFLDNLYLFDATFKFSEVLALIDDSDPSIYNNYVDITLRQHFIPSINTEFTYTLNFNNPLEPGTVSMTWTNLASEVMTITDDSSGLLVLARDGVVVNSSTVGTIDYTTGSVELSDFNPNLSSAETLRLSVDPANPDVTTVNNNILLKGNITVNLENINTA